MTICPKCKTRMTISHAMQAGPTNMTHRAVCANPECKCIATLVTFIAVVDPAHGEGYTSVAAKIGAGQVGVEINGLEPRKRYIETSRFNTVGTIKVEVSTKGQVAKTGIV